ncbi:MAG TPA: glycosyltransferase [Allocoleopsis sp.]
MLLTFQLVFVLLIASSIVFYAWCAIATIRFFPSTKTKTSLETSFHPPASILIPVSGIDEGALDNWLSFCQQDYEHYEVVFGVMNSKDLAVPVLEKIVAMFPNRARLIFCTEVRGINYQISNLMHLLEAARHEIIVLTNDDMRVKPEYLRRVIAPLSDASVGIVTCGYLGHNPKFPTAAIASLGRCVDFIPSVLVARDLEGGMQFALGATMATRKSLLQKVNGLPSVANRVGSDYHIGNLVVNEGYRIELSPYILETDSGNESLQQLLRRELRWARTSRWQRGLLYYSIATTYGTVYCLPLLLLSGFQNWALLLSGSAIVLRAIQSLVAIFWMDAPKLARWFWLLPIRDLLNFGIWVAGGIGQSIYWRGRQLKIGVGGILTD